jgi:DNA-binding CsgD family transcriptional regulator/tetratricopeptide (TPR) repeat protein
LSHAKQRTDFEGFSSHPQSAVSVTELRRPGESPVARGPHHRAKTLKDGYLDNAGAMVGREHERHLLGGLVESLSVGGAAVVIHGEPGMGKTALLGFVADCAKRRDARILTARGIESEAVLPFAAITDLLWPLQEHFATLPAIQREALEVCLALSAGPPRGPLAACAGALSVLIAAAEQNPLVILVDDFQWLDAESAQMLLFVARRLSDEPLAMVLAVRAEPDVAMADTGLPILSLTGLSTEECAQLATAMNVSLSPRKLTSLVRSTGGNPLAVVERLRLAGAGGGDEGSWAGSESTGLHHSLERTWGRLFDQLPEDARTALFVVVADQDAGGRHAVQALKSLGLSLASLGPAERLGLVASSADAIRLSHPLLRSVVLARTPLSGRAAGYRALAEIADGYSRAWYLAAAAIGPDEAVATALVAAAGEARQRTGLQASARTLHRAAELTANPSVRAERLLQAAHDAHLAGDSSSAVAWCEQALRYRDNPSFLVDVQRVAGGALTSLGEPRRALELMTGAAARARPSDPVRAAEILAEATGPAIMQGEMHQVRELAEQVECIWEQHPSDAATIATSTALAMVAGAFSISGDIARAAVYLRRVAELPPSSNKTAELHGAAFHAQSLGWAERYSEAHYQLTILLDAARRLGSPTILAFALAISAEIGWWSGQWTTAYADATEALQWATENGQPGLVAYSLSMLARIEAARGERESCQAHILQAQREVEPRGVGGVPVYAHAALGLSALSAGELSEAAEKLQHAWDLALRQGINNPNVFPISGDLAEALARAAQSDRCTQVVTWLEERSRATGLAYPRAVAFRALGILATEPEEAQRLFAASLAALEAVGPVPFEQARTLLCTGEALRRIRRPADARVPFNRALGIFDGLGARPWAARARAELAASGVKGRRLMVPASAPMMLEELSPQELQVARMAALGHNNIEVAAALFVSRKTVEAHLTRVYRKLGIRSRTQLARILLTNGITD